jgi:hypothetical protein
MVFLFGQETQDTVDLSAVKSKDIVSLLVVVHTTATFPNCGELLRDTFQMNKCLDNPQGVCDFTNPSETEWKWVWLNRQHLRYSPHCR